MLMSTRARRDAALPVALDHLVLCFGRIAMTTGQASVQAMSAKLMSGASGIVGVGEVFGDGIAPATAGFVAQHYCIQYDLSRTGVLVLEALVVLSLRETSPLRAKPGAEATAMTRN
jgi:hypothetical protein